MAPPVPSLRNPAVPLSFYRTFADFTDAGANLTLTLVTPEAGTVLQDATIECLEAFAGGSIATATISLGVTGEETNFASPKSVFALGSQVSNYVGGFVFDGATSLVAKIIVTGGNLDDLSAGKVRLAVSLLNRDGLQGPVTLEILSHGGVTAITAGIGISINAATGEVTITNTGLINSATQTSGTNNLASSTDNSALAANGAGSNNLAFSSLALGNNTTGDNNAALGWTALQGNISGSNNIAILDALELNTTGNGNIALGSTALPTSIDGDGNLGVGQNSGNGIVHGDANLFIGNNAVAAGDFSNAIAIGAGTTVNASNTVQIGDANIIAMRVGAAVAVASLPPAATVGAGSRAFATNSNATLAAGLGNTVAGGGANFVPVYSDGTNWKIG